MGALPKLFHLLAIAHFAFTIYYDVYVMDLSKFLKPIPGVCTVMCSRFRFLTFWNVMLNAIVYTICFINDVLGNNNKERRSTPTTTQNKNGTPQLRKLQDTMISCLAFPISMFVALTFWGLYAVDRELVLPKALDPYFPTWLNHCMHTNIVLFMLIEVTYFSHRYPRRPKGLAINLSFMLVYLVWVHIIHSYTGTWVYPILAVLTLPYRIVFFAGLLGLSLSLYAVGEKYHRYVWGAGDNTAMPVRVASRESVSRSRTSTTIHAKPE